MSADDAGYDPEYEDACIIVDRTTTLSSFTIKELCGYLGCCENTVYRGIKRGRYPRPEWPGDRPFDPDRWSRRQLIEIVAKRLEAGQKVPA